MSAQNYKNHRRFVPGFHIVLACLLFVGFAASVINIATYQVSVAGYFNSVLIAILFICAMLLFWFCRQFPLKAQDRAIRAEESLRYFILTGKALDRRLSVGQIAALRFAGDPEFVELVSRTMTESLSPDMIKKAIKDWRADHHRA
jgi:hypothetical protein